VIDLSVARLFRLRPGGVECSSEGLRVGGVDLLTRSGFGPWARREQGETQRELAGAYGRPIDLCSKRQGLDSVAEALDRGEIARAQIAALLLRFPEPPTDVDDEPEKQRLTRDLIASELLKADDSWDDQHPRGGSSSGDAHHV